MAGRHRVIRVAGSPSALAPLQRVFTPTSVTPSALSGIAFALSLRLVCAVWRGAGAAGFLRSDPTEALHEQFIASIVAAKDTGGQLLGASLVLLGLRRIADGYCRIWRVRTLVLMFHRKYSDHRIRL